MLNDTIVVMHQRIPGHNLHGAGVFHLMMSYGVVLYSRDGDQTWSKPSDLPAACQTRTATGVEWFRYRTGPNPTRTTLHLWDTRSICTRSARLGMEA